MIALLSKEKKKKNRTHGKEKNVFLQIDCLFEGRTGCKSLLDFDNTLSQSILRENSVRNTSLKSKCYLDE